MSKIALTPNASGSGVFTVASPNSSTDRTLTLPDETGTVDTLQRAGNVIQVVNFQTGAVDTGTTIAPWYDDGVPQNTEGTEFMTLAITPTSATNKLKIEVSIQVSNSSEEWIFSGLFQDTTAAALAIVIQYQPTLTAITNQTIIHNMTSGTTAATTFKLRAGANIAGTTTFNGNNAARRGGGTMISSITITEYAV